MSCDIRLILPEFTDMTRTQYLDQVLSKVNEKDVIMMEFFDELKDLTLEYMVSQMIGFETYNRQVNDKIHSIDKTFPKNKIVHISFTHAYIIQSLKGKNFKSFETLEDYSSLRKGIDERNIGMYKRIGKLLSKYQDSDNFIILMAEPHSQPIARNLERENELNINKYLNELKLKEFKKIEKKQNDYSFVLTYSRFI